MRRLSPRCDVSLTFVLTTTVPSKPGSIPFRFICPLFLSLSWMLRPIGARGWRTLGLFRYPHQLPQPFQRGTFDLAHSLLRYAESIADDSELRAFEEAALDHHARTGVEAGQRHADAACAAVAVDRLCGDLVGQRSLVGDHVGERGAPLHADRLVKRYDPEARDPAAALAARGPHQLSVPYDVVVEEGAHP